MAKDNQRNTSDPGAAKENSKSKPGAEKGRAKKGGWNKADYIRKAEESGIENAEQFTVAELRSKLSKLKQEGKYKGGCENNGGDKRRGTREQMEAAQDQVADHAMEEVEMLIRDPENPSQPARMKMTRVQALMTRLFMEGKKGNVQAITAYLDRFMGKPKQAVEHSGEIKTEEQNMPTAEEEAAARAYEQALQEGKPVKSPMSV